MQILDLQVALVSLEVLVIATAVIGGALSRERDAAGQQAGSFERILSSLHSVVLTERVWPDESAETLFLGPGLERLLGRPVTPRHDARRRPTRRCTPTTGAAVAGERGLRHAGELDARPASTGASRARWAATGGCGRG